MMAEAAHEPGAKPEGMNLQQAIEAARRMAEIKTKKQRGTAVSEQARIHSFLLGEFEKFRKDERENGRPVPAYVDFLERVAMIQRQNLGVYAFLEEMTNELLDLFPECPDHQPRCIPHAIEWVKARRTDEQPEDKHRS